MNSDLLCLNEIDRIWTSRFSVGSCFVVPLLYSKSSSLSSHSFEICVAVCIVTVKFKIRSAEDCLFGVFLDLHIFFRGKFVKIPCKNYSRFIHYPSSN